MLFHRLHAVPTLSGKAGKRSFSLLSTHDSLPTTLYRFQFGRDAAQFDENQQPPGWSKDAVRVSKDGLVHSQISKSSPYSNGPVFMPNTRTMQQMLRFDFERYEEDVEDGKSVICPLILRINRGTIIPPSLTLWREGTTRFSLQPKSPLRLEEFNKELDNFYGQSATFLEVKQWIENHPYKESAPDAEEKTWMHL
ncbi:hypothetical protein N7466_009429 [Penicillium verhagenii]|uniref:uncharacterized protein n=1 Tax=Penicillium verhagenii TaxID=1562060 RepID=UPI0025451DA0|nr:uncharacterized protein N7466_009429 [Penicillium verhagenii]KAJ5921103.1 hypothetical protein N7466_009429 [Penicillium verhagenii]